MSFSPDKIPKPSVPLRRSVNIICRFHSLVNWILRLAAELRLDFKVILISTSQKKQRLSNVRTAAVTGSDTARHLPTVTFTLDQICGSWWRLSLSSSFTQSEDTNVRRGAFVLHSGPMSRFRKASQQQQLLKVLTKRKQQTLARNASTYSSKIECATVPTYFNLTSCVKGAEGVKVTE